MCFNAPAEAPPVPGAVPPTVQAPAPKARRLFGPLWLQVLVAIVRGVC